MFDVCDGTQPNCTTRSTQELSPSENKANKSSSRGNLFSYQGVCTLESLQRLVREEHCKESRIRVLRQGQEGIHALMKLMTAMEGSIEFIIVAAYISLAWGLYGWLTAIGFHRLACTRHSVSDIIYFTCKSILKL